MTHVEHDRFRKPRSIDRIHSSDHNFGKRQDNKLVKAMIGLVTMLVIAFLFHEIQTWNASRATQPPIQHNHATMP